MLFWKRKKKFDEEEIEKIIGDYTTLLREKVGTYLPRRMRRALKKKSKEWNDLSKGEKKKEVEEIKKTGLSSWLEKMTEETYKELASIVPEATSMQEDLWQTLKDFKKKWNIK